MSRWADRMGFILNLELTYEVDLMFISVYRSSSTHTQKTTKTLMNLEDERLPKFLSLNNVLLVYEECWLMGGDLVEKKQYQKKIKFKLISVFLMHSLLRQT